MDRFAGELLDLPVYYPLEAPTAQHRRESEEEAQSFSLQEFVDSSLSIVPANSSSSSYQFRHWSISDYLKRYRSHELTPLQGLCIPNRIFH